jgi:hypothetical protein
METFLEVGETVQLERIQDEQGTITYVRPNGDVYDSRGRVANTKFESLVEEEPTKQTTEQQRIQNKTQTTYKQTMSGNTQFFEGVHEFTEGIALILLKEFEGKVVGSDEMNLGTMMKELVGDYKPGDKVKKVKKTKKKDSDSPKKKRALSGYTYFGQVHREEFNAELEKQDPKPKYITYQSAKWKELSTEEKGEWKVKAKAHHEASEE